ncbi:hypothetical protein [Pseudolysinimonas sp.]|jgi:hypothetical protein|uniref:hypothetical protein n=1 Tax=Pseudolysinimonas sp. TaxID=2680009 RepID=UPI003783CCFD
MTTTDPSDRLRTIARRTLVGVLAFTLISAVGGGVAMLATDGLGMPVAMLANGPFSGFVGPALILMFVVGGTHALAGVLLVLRRESALLWSAVAGFGVMIWIYVETGIIAGNSWLQVIYFATGVVELVLVLALLGIVRWLPRRPLRNA